MSHTNSTENYGLPQWIGSDKPTFLGDFNTAFGKIDEVMKDNEDAATAAVNTANTAANAASTASTNATTALNTANSAATDAANAVTTAGTADTKATQALAAASGAETAAAANTITNLAPAYDNTLTYAVGDLVTYVDAQGSGRLYKCIVAIDTPEEFNINKWDDVTTSEVYEGKSTLVSSAIADGVKTVKQLLNELCAGLTFNTNSEYDVRVELDNGRNFSYHTRDLTSGVLECYLASVVTNGAVIEELNLDTEGNSQDLKFTIYGGSTPPTYEDISNTFVPTARTYKLYETPI